MDQTLTNPPTNQLGAGISEDQLSGAVEKSSYPLQTIVGDFFRTKFVGEDTHFYVQDEWCYVDRDSKELRTVDLLANLRLHEWEPQPRVRPQLSLLIECKQSTLPYVFFEASRTPSLYAFPTIAGLREDKVELTTNDDASTWAYTIPHVLDLVEEPFQAALSSCHTLSKCVRKGAEIELSGSEAYNGLVLPLVKALRHFVHSRNPIDTAWYFDCHATLAIGVLDAPMISVRAEKSGHVLTATPWVRVVRHEYEEEAEHLDHEQFRAIDLVHKDFLEIYLEEHLLPFARCFGERVLRHPTELATGQAFAPKMGSNSWDQIESRMLPRTVGPRIGRAKSIGRNLIEIISRRKPQI